MKTKVCTLVLALGALTLFAVVGKPTPLPDSPAGLKVISITPTGEAEVSLEGERATLRKGQRVGIWTLMAVITAGEHQRFAVFEDFTDKRGHIVFVDNKGVQVDLPKSLEPTFADPASLYRGHTLQEVMNSDRDLLGEEILAALGDPTYDDVAVCFPPISKMHTYTFVGTHESIEKIGFEYGGLRYDFDPAPYVPEIRKIRKDGRVWDGLVGGWLPVVRFVYPEEAGNWSEMLAYAPMRRDNDNKWVQPVWSRISRVEGKELKWVRYFDSYHPFPPRMDFPAELFYAELLAMRAGWINALEDGMRIDIPDQRLANMARHSLVRDMITRIGAQPKYGVVDRHYAGNQHDGFPDTFNADTTAMVEWGLFDLAGQYIENYFSKFVRDDGSILYGGPETGQYGRMLTVVAEYAEYTGDHKLLLRNRHRIDAVAKLLLSMREKALRFPATDPTYGMIVGWSEADARGDPEPSRYMQPYFSNSTEAARGFRDLGGVWQRIARQQNQPDLAAWGQRLVQESEALQKDIQTAIGRSILKDTDPVCLPAIAGVKEPFHVAVARDPLDPQFRSYRAYMEMLFSGNLTREQVEMIVNYRAAHKDTILGVPTAYGYNTHELVGFLTYGHAYGLLQHDFARRFLLTLYGIMAHQYTRGTWTAPETRNVDPSRRQAAPYCTPAQLVVPMMARWMLVFEDPESPTLWLAKGTPRSWLEDGKKISVSSAPTKWGRVGFTITSRLREGKVEGQLELPVWASPGVVKVRLRVPEGKQMHSVTLNGKAWQDFNPQEETISLPEKVRGTVLLVVSYK
jgi:hypothetical protein